VVDAGYYGPANVCGHRFWTVVDACNKYAAQNVTHDGGIRNTMSPDTSGIAKAVALCAAADTCIVSVGSDTHWAAEGHDATNISYTDAQQQLVTQAAAASKKPIIVLTLTGTPLDMGFMLTNPKVGAVLHLGQPSVTVLGLAEVLFKEGGRSPAGRACQTIYPSSYQDEVSIFDFNMRPGQSAFVRPDCTAKCDSPPDNDPNHPWDPRMHGGPCGDCQMGTNPGRTHRFYTGKAVVPFGMGLSYSTFSYSLASAPTGPVSLDTARAMIAQTKADGRTFPDSRLLRATPPTVKYEINVTNTGSVDADEVVLGFLKPPGAGVGGVPLQTLYGFARVHLKKGETKTVELYPSMDDLTQVDQDGTRYALSGRYKFAFGVQHESAPEMAYTEHEVMMV
jgi:pre-mRNA-splicing factor SYF2/beta-D-xylosidase 4